MNTLIEAAVVALIQSMAPAFEQMVLFQPTRQEFSREGLYKAQATMLIGSFPEENRSIELTAPLEFDEIYLTDNERKVEPLRLAPFLLWQRSDSSNQFETYVYNEAWNSKLVYVSHASGDHYYHTELHHGFEQLVKLQLSPGIEEDRFNDLSPAQREEAADTYFKRAVHSRQKGHLEAAIVELEASAEYVRHYQTFLEMARVLMELGDYSAAALRIESCLDMSPNDPSALQLAEDMRNIDNREQPIPPPSPESDQEDLPHPTLFHAITPKGFQYYSVLWCMGIFMIWYVPSIVLEIAYVNLQSGLAIFGLLLCCTLHVVGFAGTRQRLLDARTPLSLQVNERIERFDAFFDTNMSATFGRWHQLSTERKFFVGCAIWTVCVATISVAITSLHLPSALILKRWVDFAILDALMFYQARGIIGLTRAVWLYSQRSLKPFLSRVTDGGLRAFGPPVTYAVGLACVWWIIYWSAASILVHTEHWVDLLLLFIGTGLFIIWSLGLPLALYRSALASKSNAGADYAQHLQTAFAAFIKEPDQARLERYQWLLKQQAVIGKTPVWPLTLSQTVIVALVSNAILLSTDLLYIVNRFSISLSELARLVGLR